MSEIVKKLDNAQIVRTAVNAFIAKHGALPTSGSTALYSFIGGMFDQAQSEAIAALQPSSAEREELATKFSALAEYYLSTGSDSDKRLLVLEAVSGRYELLSSDLAITAALLRTPVAVDDAMVERARKAYHDGMDSTQNRMRRALEAALQAGRK